MSPEPVRDAPQPMVNAHWSVMTWLMIHRNTLPRMYAALTALQPQCTYPRSIVIGVVGY